MFGLTLIKLIGELLSPAAIWDPAMLKAMEETGLFETRTCFVSPVCKLVPQSLTMPSFPADAILFPYGLNAIHPPISCALTLTVT